jgi:hypothetical protein
VDPAHSHDAQRNLEQHALRNVGSLAERLTNADALDRKQDKALLVGIGVAVAAVVIYIGTRMVLSPEDPTKIERHRCELDKAVHIVDRLRAELKQANPSLTQQDLEKRVRITHSDVKSEAKQLCAGGI